MATFISTRARASSSTPVLSETLMRACLTTMLIAGPGGWAMGDEARGASRAVALPCTHHPQRRSRFNLELLDFFTQRVAIDAQPLGRRRLVALGVVQHDLEHGLFHVLQHHVVDRARALAVQVLEIFFQGLADAIGDFAGARHAANSS